MNGNSQKEYIERATVLRVLEEYYPGRDERLHIVKDIVSIPAAGVVEVRHGRWIFKEYDEMPWCTQAICSECGAVVENNSRLSTSDLQQYFVEENKYCRRCSARMDAKEDAK